MQQACEVAIWDSPQGGFKCCPTSSAIIAPANRNAILISVTTPVTGGKLSTSLANSFAAGELDFNVETLAVKPDRMAVCCNHPSLTAWLRCYCTRNRIYSYLVLWQKLVEWCKVLSQNQPNGTGWWRYYQTPCLSLT